MNSFKTTTFRKGYNPTFEAFSKSHAKIFSKGEMKKAHEACIAKPEEAKADESKK